MSLSVNCYKDSYITRQIKYKLMSIKLNILNILDKLKLLCYILIKKVNVHCLNGYKK